VFERGRHTEMKRESEREREREREREGGREGGEGGSGLEVLRSIIVVKTRIYKEKRVLSIL